MNVMKSFREALSNAKHVLILTGSGISAESGIPTFRGAGGFWRKYQAQNLATPEAFTANPSLVWEFYEYRRRVANEAKPNKAHEAIASFQDRALKEGKNVTIITQNIDELHQRAGASNVVELHGSLYKTRCTVCNEVAVNTNIPICPALEGKGSPDPNIMISNIPKNELPLCQKENCKGLLRPHIVWFGENLDEYVLKEAFNAVENCDTCLVIGTSSIVYPAAMFAPQVANRGIPVAEFNLESTPATRHFMYHFEGPCTITVTEALNP
ncbi:NAD-dependent protein deacylase sirtuin-5, mitochondrial-like [Hylaeus anthracinus]|uniref:NAD-dependent protein deacylase sirtuin-5, mitochondrial-like n=1 Tax=Hylaeus volcanicus TaxID=313075 RepID=UPI0023B79EED|nr:NAD-dependent protein deacylase sirtuin-5, mitochondrial-like [Hylaeus volcanicus]XP_053998122.1 NAD-dependent protein deacylase sirtuin-5, mitochondrial-like [Hylaeus anthracinus]